MFDFGQLFSTFFKPYIGRKEGFCQAIFYNSAFRCMMASKRKTKMGANNIYGQTENQDQFTLGSRRYVCT
jgi:hypothetical protein